MSVISRGRTIISIEKNKSVIKSEYEKDIVLDPVSGYTPVKDDLVALNTADSKHCKYNTATATHEIEGVIMDYDSASKTARICVRGRIQKKDLGLTIASGKDRVAERAMRLLGLDLV